MNDRARELLERALLVIDDLSGPNLRSVDSVMKDIKRYLAEPEQDEEPVAWISHNGFRFNADIEPIEHGIEVPLYLHPAPRQEPEQDEVVILTASQIASEFTEPYLNQWNAFVAGVRFAEKHHGIGGRDE